jgi:hypothetical protein
MGNAMGLMQRARDALQTAGRSRPRASDHDAEAETEASAAVTPGIGREGPISPATVLRLQDTHGNRFVQRLLQRQATEGDCPGGC